MKSITIKIVSIDTDKITGYEIGGQNNENKDKIVEIKLNKSIYSGLLAEMKKNNIMVDKELKCFVDKVFTIVETIWNKPPKGLIVTPILFSVTLRKDLMNNDYDLKICR